MARKASPHCSAGATQLCPFEQIFFSLKKKKNHTPLGVFISDPHVSGELFFRPLQLPDPFSFISDESCPTPPLFLSWPHAPLAPFPFPGKLCKTSSLHCPHLLQAGHLGLQAILSLGLQGLKERNLNPFRHLGAKMSSRQAHFQPAMVKEKEVRRVSHRLSRVSRLGPALQESQTFLLHLRDTQAERSGQNCPARGTKSEAAVLGRCARPQPGEPRPQDPIGKDPLGTGQERAEKGQDRRGASLPGVGAVDTSENIQKPGFPSAYIPLSETRHASSRRNPVGPQRALSLTADLQPQFPGASVGHAAPGVVR